VDRRARVAVLAVVALVGVVVAPTLLPPPDPPAPVVERRWELSAPVLNALHTVEHRYCAAALALAEPDDAPGTVAPRAVALWGSLREQRSWHDVLEDMKLRYPGVRVPPEVREGLRDLRGYAWCAGGAQL